MKWLIAVCAVLIALGIFVEPRTVKISGDDIAPIVVEHRRPSWSVPPAVATSGTFSGPTWTTVSGPIPAGSNTVSCVSSSTQQMGCRTGAIR